MAALLILTLIMIYLKLSGRLVFMPWSIVLSPIWVPLVATFLAVLWILG